MRCKAMRAFTLVEILIVIVILGILAAIVVPQFTNPPQKEQPLINITTANGLEAVGSGDIIDSDDCLRKISRNGSGVSMDQIWKKTGKRDKAGSTATNLDSAAFPHPRVIRINMKEYEGLNKQFRNEPEETDPSNTTAPSLPPRAIPPK